MNRPPQKSAGASPSDPPGPQEKLRTPEQRKRRRLMRAIAVPVMLFVSSVLMAVAWLGHLRFEDSPFLLALAISWLIVFPEYVLNVAAVRMGKGIYSGGTMATLNLSWGVICVMLVARFVLNEEVSTQQYVGFGLMLFAMLLIGSKDHSAHLPDVDLEEERE